MNIYTLDKSWWCLTRAGGGQRTGMGFVGETTTLPKASAAAARSQHTHPPLVQLASCGGRSSLLLSVEPPVVLLWVCLFYVVRIVWY